MSQEATKLYSHKMYSEMFLQFYHVAFVHNMGKKNHYKAHTWSF